MTSPSSIPCLNLECSSILDQARAYVRAKLDGAFCPSYADLGQTLAYQTVRADIAAGLAAGDLDATKEACRRWCRLVITWTKEQANE